MSGTVLSKSIAERFIESSMRGYACTLTGCFASIDGGIPELGLGSAQTSAVLNAWIRYLTLRRSAEGVSASPR